MPDKILYENDFESSSVLMLKRHTTGLQALSANHVAFLEHNASGNQKQLMDVGCGDGIFLEMAQSHGWDVWGIDLDEKSIEVGRKRGLKQLYNQTMQEFSVSSVGEKKVYDVITFFEVLEHQSDPMLFLRSLHPFLRNGGLIAGSVPNRNRFTLFTDESGDLPPYHFTRWDCSALEFALKRTGFVDVCVTTVGYGYYLRNLSQPVKVWIRRKVARNVNPIDLAVRSVEKLEGVHGLSSAQLLYLKLLKSFKTALFWPFEELESLLERLSGKGQMIYFQARWPGAGIKVRA